MSWCGVQYVLKNSGQKCLSGSMAVNKPLLMMGNREVSLRYVKLHKNWTENEWQQVWWSHQSKFKFFLFKSSSLCMQHINSESLQPSIKHIGGSVMVSAAFQSVMLEILIIFMDLWTRKSTIRLWSKSDCQCFYFSPANNHMALQMQ